MLLPQAYLRKLRLQSALHAYPMYDPPHKVEEYLLPKKKAAENFDYFMRVREQRVAYFRDWLRQHFKVTVTFDEKGVRALSRWGNKYAGLLLAIGPDGHPTDSYFTYDPPWKGANAGHNVLFDMAITIGEAIIANCPKLRWDFDPISAALPRTAKMLKRESGMSFQRPMLTGFEDLVSGKMPLHDVYGFADQMMRNMTTFSGFNRFHSFHRADRRLILDQLLNNFKHTLIIYPAGDPDKLREHMEPQEYLKFIDAQSADEDNGDD